MTIYSFSLVTLQVETERAYRKEETAVPESPWNFACCLLNITYSPERGRPRLGRAQMEQLQVFRKHINFGQRPSDRESIASG